MLYSGLYFGVDMDSTTPLQPRRTSFNQSQRDLVRLSKSWPHSSTLNGRPTQYTGPHTDSQHTGSHIPPEHDARNAEPIIVTPAMRETIDAAILRVRVECEDAGISEGRCIELLCADFLSGFSPIVDNSVQKIESQKSEIETLD